VKKLFSVLFIALASPLLGGCLDSGSSAEPPTLSTTPIAEDGRVKITWTASPGVNYWLFTATDPSLTAFVWANLPNAHVFQSATSPFYMCGLLNETTYYFAANGRIDGGPSGASSPTISATPRHAGDTWSANTSLTTENLNGVGYVGLTTCSNNTASASGSFAAVGTGGAIFTSTDGKSWKSTASTGLTSDLHAVTGYAANQNNTVNPALRWVAVGASGASVYSTDGNTWISPPSGTGTTNNLNGITHGGIFVAVGDSGTIRSSTDGISWTVPASVPPAGNLNGVTHAGIYVAVGDGGTILTSLDGSTWIAGTSGTSNNLQKVSSIGNTYVAVGDSGTIVTSVDGGVTWTAKTITGSPANPSFKGIAANSRFVAVDSGGKAYTSNDGVTWSTTVIDTTATQLNALVGSGFGYVAVGNAGATASSF